MRLGARLRLNIDISTVVVASKDQISCELGGEAAILNLKEGFYYGLDEVGSAVWQLIAEPRRVSEIRDELLDIFEVDSDQCSADLIRLLGELRTRGLIQVVDDANS
jgi:Coenzyme PQQ synthesis protein D (PqqD)